MIYIAFRYINQVCYINRVCFHQCKTAMAYEPVKIAEKAMSYKKTSIKWLMM